MPQKFSPNGYLDVASDPSELPSAITGNVESSGALRRCTNLHLDRAGTARTRDGSTLASSAAIAAPASALIVQAGERYAAAGANLYRDEVAIAADLTAGEGAAVLYNAYSSTVQAVFYGNGTDRRRIEGSTVAEWGIEAPTDAPSAGWGAGVGLTGDYYVRYTYCRKEGSQLVSESNPSEASAKVTLANQSIDVKWTPSTDPQVTHVRIYRTPAGGSNYYYQSETAIGTEEVDSNVADAALGAEVEYDHVRPPAGAILAGPTFNGYLLMALANKVYWSKPRQPEYWPSSYYAEVSALQFPVKGLVEYMGSWYVLTIREIYQMQGTGPTSFFTVPMKALCGTTGPRAVAAAAGVGIYHVGPDGIYLFSSGDANVTKPRFAPIFRGETVGSIPGVDPEQLDHCLLQAFGERVYFAYRSLGGSSCYDLLVFSTATDRVVHYRYPFGIDLLAVDDNNHQLLAACDDGYIRRIEDPLATTDADSPIAWQIESKSFADQLYKYFPRYAKYDVELTAIASAAGYVLLDDAVVQTHLAIASRSSKMRHVAGCTGNRLGLRITGTGPAVVYAAEVE